jgi:hypothetical protein
MDIMPTRYDQLVRMGFKPPRSRVERMRKEVWDLIDDSLPPEGEADGEFTSFQQWVNKAPSWIGGTGAKAFDAKGRPCRNGGDMQRARDEAAFPVRWYLPERFPAPPTFGIRRANGGATVTMNGEALAALRKDGAEWVVGMEGDPEGERRFPSPARARDWLRFQWWPRNVRRGGVATRIADCTAREA